MLLLNPKTYNVIIYIDLVEHYIRVFFNDILDKELLVKLFMSSFIEIV